MRKNSCLLCKSSRIKVSNMLFFPFLNERVFNHIPPTNMQYLFCENCNFSYPSYAFTEEEMNNLYSGYRGEEYTKQRAKYEAKYRELHEELFGSFSKKQEERKDLLYNFLHAHIDISCYTKVLDYGGSTGLMLTDDFINAKRYVYDISGIELLQNIERATEENIQNIKWDCIMCLHVLEHLPHPEETLERLYTLLEKGGILYIEVPYEKYSIDYCAKTDTHTLHEHINRFTQKTFDIFFNKKDCIIIANNLSAQNNIQFLVKKISTESEETILLWKRINSSKETTHINTQEEKCLKATKKNPFRFIKKIFSIKKIQEGTQLRILGIKIILQKK